MTVTSDLQQLPATHRRNSETFIWIIWTIGLLDYNLSRVTLLLLSPYSFPTLLQAIQKYEIHSTKERIDFRRQKESIDIHYIPSLHTSDVTCYLLRTTYCSLSYWLLCPFLGWVIDKNLGPSFLPPLTLELLSPWFESQSQNASKLTPPNLLRGLPAQLQTPTTPTIPIIITI